MQEVNSCAAWQTHIWPHKDRVMRGRTQTALNTALTAMPDDKHDKQSMHHALWTLKSICLHPLHASLMHALAQVTQGPEPP